MIFVRRLRGGVALLDLSADATFADLQTAITRLDGIPAHSQSLLLATTLLTAAADTPLRSCLSKHDIQNGSNDASSSSSSLSPVCALSVPSPDFSDFDDVTITVLSRLRGGKGGFGAKLRSATGKVGAKKTTNFSSCRDLSGRRIRHVEAERALLKWIADESATDQTDVSARFAAINRAAPGNRIRPDGSAHSHADTASGLPAGRPIVGGGGGAKARSKPCQYGAACATRGTTCPRSHPGDLDAEADAAAAAVAATEQARREELRDLGKRFGQDTGGRDLEGVGAGDRQTVAANISEGLKAAAAAAAAAAATGSDSTDPKNATATAAAAAAASSQSVVIGDKEKKAKIAGMFSLGIDLSDSSDDDDNEEEDGAKKK